MSISVNRHHAIEEKQEKGKKKSRVRGGRDKSGSNTRFLPERRGAAEFTNVVGLLSPSLPRPSWMCSPLRRRRLLIRVTSGRGEDHGSEITDERIWRFIGKPRTWIYPCNLQLSPLSLLWHTRIRQESWEFRSRRRFEAAGFRLNCGFHVCFSWAPSTPTKSHLIRVFIVTIIKTTTTTTKHTKQTNNN